MGDDYWLWWTEEDGSVTCWHWRPDHGAKEVACGLKQPDGAFWDYRYVAPAASEPGCAKCRVAFQEALQAAERNE